MSAQRCSKGIAFSHLIKILIVKKLQQIAGVNYDSWLRGQDSNLRPRGYEPRELPLLHPAISWWINKRGVYLKLNKVYKTEVILSI